MKIVESGAPKFYWSVVVAIVSIVLLVIGSTHLMTGEVGHLFVAPNLSAECAPEKSWPIPLQGCMNTKNTEKIFEELGVKYQKVVIADVKSGRRRAPNLMVTYSASGLPIDGSRFNAEATFFNDRLMSVILRQSKASSELDVDLKQAIERFGSYLVDSGGSYWEWREQNVADEFARWENIYQ